MKFKVGDKVRVRTLESLVEDFGGNQNYINIDHSKLMIYEMLSLCGKVVTIELVYTESYCIKEMGYSWYDCCFEPEPVKDDDKMSDTIKIEVELKKCWVRDRKRDEWSPRWNIADTGYCVNDIEHSEIPRNILYTTKWSYMTFDDPAIKQMTHAEIEKELGYKIKIVGE